MPKRKKITPTSSEIKRIKVTDPETIKDIDDKIDTDYWELKSDNKENLFSESSRQVQDVFNLVFAKVSPDWLSIDCNRNSIIIEDKKRGVEYIYNRYLVTPIIKPDSVARCRNEFEVQKLIAQKRQKLTKKVKVNKGDWWFYPELKYNRLNLEFSEGGSVHCGLPSGEDCVPAKLNGDQNCLIGLGEFICSRPAVAMMHPEFDLEKGTEILSIIHDHYRLQAREKAYLR